MELTEIERAQLVHDIVTREGTAREIAEWYGATVDELREFTRVNMPEIQRLRESMDGEEGGFTSPTPKELDDLWISKKPARLTRYEMIANSLYEQALSGKLAGTDYATVLRELRSYMVATANELGQLLHRGSGDNADGDVLAVDFQGIDLDNLK